MRGRTTTACWLRSQAREPEAERYARQKMGMEYKIKWNMPEGYNPSAVLKKLPSPISPQMTEIYNYSVEKDGFYFRDNLVDKPVAGHAMKLFIDEALKYTHEVSISEL
jgi:hypothetical protein